jgi:hypothetical protein
VIPPYRRWLGFPNPRENLSLPIRRILNADPDLGFLGKSFKGHWPQAGPALLWLRAGLPT